MDVLVEDYLRTNDRARVLRAQQEATESNLNEMLRNAHRVHTETHEGTNTSDRGLGPKVAK